MRATPLLLVSCLVACGGDGDEGPGKTTPADTAPTTEDTAVVGTTDTETTDTETTDTDTEPTNDPYEDDVPPEGTPTVTGFAAGSIYPLPAFDGSTVQGEAQLVRYADGTSRVSVAAFGLAADTEHMAHVHTWPCEYDAGGHYKIDPAVKGTEEANEIWPSFTTNTEGVGTGWVTTGPVRGDALSVVIHDPATGDKMACADLAPVASVGGTATGTFAPFAAYDPKVDGSIAGNAEVTYSSSSSVYVSLSGLDDAETYRSHVHALPCDTLDAGGHYKLDPSNPETVEENEVWPTVEPKGGVATYDLTVSGHKLRDDAQAIVIHRVIGAEAPKVACATLERTTWNPRVQSGSPYLFPEATARGLEIDGFGSLTRRLDGVTIADVELFGLEPDEVHPIHLHDAPCDVADGGAHYYVDPDQPDLGESNELWVTVQANGGGYATRRVGIPHVARADAKALVVHASDGARLACIDL